MAIFHSEEKNAMGSNTNSSPFDQIGEDFTMQFIKKELANYLRQVNSIPLPTFEAKLSIEAYPYEPVSMTLCSKADAFMLEAAWACPLVFSHIPRADLLHLIFAVLLEKKVVIVSPNLALVSAILITLYSFIKPFTYPFPIIFMSEPLISCLEAPCPLIVGICQDMKYLVAQKLPAIYGDCHFYVIEEGKMIGFADPKERIVEPNFKELREGLSQLYPIFNPEERFTIEYSDFPPVLENPSQIVMPRLSVRPHRYIYNPNQKELDAGAMILKAFNETLTQQILDLLPENPIYFQDSKDLNYEAIAQVIKEDNPLETEFLDQFLMTQTFTFYIEQYYRNQPGKTPQ